MEKYVSNETDVQARWMYKTDESGIIHECDISTWYQTTTEVTVTIFISTGVFSVQGQACRKFAESEFDKIRSQLENSDISPPIANNEEFPKESSNVDGMWANIDANKNALVGVQESILKLFEIMKETDIKHESSATNPTDVDITKIEKKLDDKLTIFMEAYENQVEERLKRICKSFDDKFNHMKAIVTHLKINTQSQINDNYKKLWSLEDEFHEHRVEFCLWRESQRISMIKLLSDVKDTGVTNPTGTSAPPPPPPTPPPPPLTKTKAATTQQLEIIVEHPAENVSTEAEIAAGAENVFRQTENIDENMDANITETNNTEGDTDNVAIGTEDLELLLFMDSNNHHVDWNIFWKTRGVMKKVFKGSLWDIEGIVRADKRTRTVQYVLISVGVNDIDTKTAKEVSDQMEKVSELIKERYGNPKIVISEITPRSDEKDLEVIECNQMIKTYVESNENVFSAKQSGLRTADGRHFQDEKHITKYAAPIFCASL